MPRHLVAEIDRFASWRFTRRATSIAGALAIGLPAALGLTACGSSGSSNSANGKSGSPTTTKAPSDLGTSTSTSSAYAKDAGALCNEVSAATHTLAHLHLQTTSSVFSLSKTIHTDLNKVQSDVKHVQNAGHKKSGPIQHMLNAAATAVREGKTSLTEAEKGNFGNAKNAVDTAVHDLKAAKSYGTKANIRACL